MNTLLPLASLLAVVAFAAAPGTKLDDPVAESIAHPERLASDHERDAERQPQRILDFFDIKRGMRVADLMAGDGYYTELLSRAVGPDGVVHCQNTEVPLRVFADGPLTARLADDRLPNVERHDEEFDEVSFPKTLDAAILVRFYHDFAWQEVDRPAFNAMVFEHLKPGGLLGVVDHHAKDGAGITEGKRLHRVEAALVRKELEAAGFVLEAESFVLTDPGDTLDWNIFNREGPGRDATSRFVHLYRKPLTTR
ncbi:MAG: SAM-dependent methyltransferase [Planctomycetota bacterium]|nr:SAM-dependent methyltransferase [Planctomycetota bacterium]